jgi:hypothetical protein
MPTLINNSERVYGFLGGPHRVNGVKGFQLIPKERRTLSREQAEAIEADEGQKRFLQHLLETRAVLVEAADEAADEADDEADDEGGNTPQISAAELIKAIATETDLNKLEQLHDTDERATVKAAALKRAKALQGGN